MFQTHLVIVFPFVSCISHYKIKVLKYMSNKRYVLNIKKAGTDPKKEIDNDIFIIPHETVASCLSTELTG